MSDATERVEAALAGRDAGGHPVAIALISGAALGAGIGMLFAPRRGVELRKDIGEKMHEAANSCSHGYHRARDTAGEWATSGRKAFAVTCDKAAEAARGTQQYVREVAGAVTMSGKRNQDGSGMPTSVTPPTDSPGRIDPVSNAMPRRTWSDSVLPTTS
jgi:gas vesicle protein